MAAAAPHAASQGSGARGEGKDAADASGKGASEAPQRTVELLDHGVLVVRGFLTPEQQLAVVRCCFRLADPARVHENRNMYTPLFAWNWPGNKMGDYVDRAREEREPGLMDEVLNHGLDAFVAMQDFLRQTPEAVKRLPADERLRPPAHFQPRALRGILYPENGRLHAHQDMLMGCVLSLSIGQSCDFFWGPHWEIDHEETRVARLDSGDFVFLNGQKLHHGVLGLDAQSTPPHWAEAQRDGLIPARWFRLNLQFRDPARIV